MTSFAQRAQREVELIKDMEVRDKERRQEKLAELAEASRRRREAAAIEEARLRGERDAKLIREQNDRVAAQERLEKHRARTSWVAQGGRAEAFEQAWPEIWQEMLKSRTLEVEHAFRQAMRESRVSSI